MPHLCDKVNSVAGLHTLDELLHDVVAMLAADAGQHMILQLTRQADSVVKVQHLHSKLCLPLHDKVHTNDCTCPSAMLFTITAAHAALH